MEAKISLEMTGGKNIPTIGLGTWQVTEEAELEKALNAALEAGYRHIDTAFAYSNEAIIGRVLNQWLSSGKVKREELFITTKLPISGVHEDRVEMFMKKSLENLKLDYVDLYLIHFPIGTNYVEGYVWPPPDQMKLEPSNHVEIWKKMEQQVDAGRARAIGLSNFNQKQIEKVIKSSTIKPACLQIELHVLLQQQELVRFCQQNGIVVVAFSPLGSPGYNKFLKSTGKGEKELPNLLQNPLVKKIAGKHGKSSGQVLLRFLVQQDIVAIPKSVNSSRIKENIDIYDFNLDSEDMKGLYDLDIGERILDLKSMPIFHDHPEWPWKVLLN
ncbi:unnamed protein product [Phaedon cochleariae]|uniref:NADP-dependent oxidoreductase domain-containing protein n=1 Tax=Phaedon cochleariae TaxID=80249 RepID=A0A9P0DF53_PHACE|nr:unnamed protein product [Phaedon cochleariae]